MKNCIHHFLKASQYTVLILIGLALTPSLANADSQFSGRWYQIELIVFSQMTQTALTSETWPLLQANALNPANMIALQQPNTNPPANGTQASISTSTTTNSPAYRLLPSQDFTLQREQTAISRAPGYQVLLHVAWQQPVYGPNQSLPVHILGGNIYRPSGQLLRVDTNDNYNIGSDNTPQINGTLSINVQRFFNLHFNLLYAAPVSLLDRIANNDYFNQFHGNFAYFRLLQSRRMRSGELDYIDHPLFGVLVMITPIPTPANANANVNTTTSQLSQSQPG